MGPNINSVDTKGNTMLMRAVIMNHEKTIFFLLSHKDINVRMKNQYNEDALSLSMVYSYDSITRMISRRGGYTNEEIIRAYELESYSLYFHREYIQSKFLWQKSLRLRGLPINMRIFNSELPKKESDKDISLFVEHDRQDFVAYENGIWPQTCAYIAINGTCIKLCEEPSKFPRNI